MALVPARLDDGTVGFNVLVGGGLSDGPRMASDIDVFVRPDQAVEIVPRRRPALRRAGQPGEPLDLPGCATWSRSWARRRSGPSWPARAAFPLDAGRRAPRPIAIAATTSASTRRSQAGLHYVGLNVTGRSHDRAESGRGGPAGRRVRRRRDLRLATDQNFILTGVPDERLHGTAGRAAAGDPLAEPEAVRARGRGLHRQRVLPLRHRRDQGRGARAGPVSWTARVGSTGRHGSCGCTSPAARPPAPSRRSPTSASGARRPRPRRRSSRGSTSGSVAASAATPRSSTGSTGPTPVDEVPEALVRPLQPLPRRPARRRALPRVGAATPERGAASDARQWKAALHDRPSRFATR